MKTNPEKEALLKAARALIHTQEAQEFMKIRHTKSDYVKPLLLRWNAEGEVVMTLKAVSDVIGVTPEAIRQIENRYNQEIAFCVLGLSQDEAIEKIKQLTKIWTDRRNKRQAVEKQQNPKAVATLHQVVELPLEEDLLRFTCTSLRGFAQSEGIANNLSNLNKGQMAALIINAGFNGDSVRDYLKAKGFSVRETCTGKHLRAVYGK